MINKNYVIGLIAFLMGIIVSWLLISSINNEKIKNVTDESNVDKSINNCLSEKESIENLTNEISTLTDLNNVLSNEVKKNSIKNIEETSDMVEAYNSYDNIDNIDEKDIQLEKQNKFIKRLYNTNWKEKPEELAKIILANKRDEVYYASLVIAQKGFNADEDKINEVNMVFANIYSETNNNELKSNVVDYLSNIEPDLFDVIHSDFSIELDTAINEYIKNNYIKE